jgi:two-component system, OmpR family, osmolarity sensor histidine kinase EnvZ
MVALPAAHANDPGTALEDSGMVPLETQPAPLGQRPRKASVSLFWRTFLLLTVLLLGTIAAWLQTLRAFELEPRALQTAQQIASLVNLSRAALVHADAIQRVSLIKTMKAQEGVRIFPREPGDQFEDFSTDTMSRNITAELVRKLGPGTTAARSVNGEPGLWVGFQIEQDSYWLLTDRSRFDSAGGTTWLIWLGIAALLSLAGAAAIARLINRPLKNLSFAASRLREGDLQSSRLDEGVATSEIREVNIGFNRMVQRLSAVEQDRAIMLAGISHDLRTPLARLRLETEMSVADPEARAHMASDIEQLDAVIDKFLDYARPGEAALDDVSLNEVVATCVSGVRDSADVQFQLDLTPDCRVRADAVELGRVITNLIENARRYGRDPNTGIVRIDIAARPKDEWLLFKLRDHGQGVDPALLPSLTKPFFRADNARTAANGAGLGLSIVERSLQGMGAKFALVNTHSGGLAAHIKFQRAF